MTSKLYASYCLLEGILKFLALAFLSCQMGAVKRHSSQCLSFQAKCPFASQMKVGLSDSTCWGKVNYYWTYFNFKEICLSTAVKCLLFAYFSFSFTLLFSILQMRFLSNAKYSI